MGFVDIRGERVKGLRRGCEQEGVNVLTIWGEPLVSAWFLELVNEVHSVVQLCRGKTLFQ